MTHIINNYYYKTRLLYLLMKKRNKKTSTHRTHYSIPTFKTNILESMIVNNNMAEPLATLNLYTDLPPNPAAPR